MYQVHSIMCPCYFFWWFHAFNFFNAFSSVHPQALNTISIVLFTHNADSLAKILTSSFHFACPNWSFSRLQSQSYTFLLLPPTAMSLYPVLLPTHPSVPPFTACDSWDPCNNTYPWKAVLLKIFYWNWYTGNISTTKLPHKQARINGV